MDKWILSHLSKLVINSNQQFKAYNLHLAALHFSEFWVNHLCDIYLVSEIW